MQVDERASREMTNFLLLETGGRMAGRKQKG